MGEGEGQTVKQISYITAGGAWCSPEFFYPSWEGGGTGPSAAPVGICGVNLRFGPGRHLCLRQGVAKSLSG